MKFSRRAERRLRVAPRRSYQRALGLAAAMAGCAVSQLTAGVPQHASPGTYYVGPAGSDSNAGTRAAPFRTIQKAAAVVNPGDVVVVEDGVYTDHDGDGAVVRLTRGGMPNAPLTFRAAHRWRARLDGEHGRTANGFEVDAGAGWIRIEGFEISGFANVGTPRGSASGIDLYDGGHHVEIVGNHIHDIGRVCTNARNTNGQVGIFVQQPHVLIDGNVIHDIGRFFPGENGCSYAPGFRGYESLDHAIYLNGNEPGASHATIRNNVIYNTRHGWAVQWYPGSLTNVHVLHNTFAFGNPRRRHTSIVLNASISASSIVNNVFYNPEGGATIEAAKFSGAMTIAHNLTTGTAITDRRSPGMTLVSNRVRTDARLVNPAAFDFRLQEGSPAIDAGQPLSAVRHDIDGRARPRGAGPDVGAVEY